MKESISNQGNTEVPSQALSQALSIHQGKYFTVFRQGKFLWSELHGPHLTLTTSQINGGQNKHLRYLLNHQSCEGKGHSGPYHDLPREEYHRQVCAETSLPELETAVMGTAANMQNVAIVEESYAEISVCAIVTAGVQGNAGRAGDKALWHEGENQWHKVHAEGGTINTLLLFNWPLAPAALTRAVATMTEAKSAVLLELAISSRSSQGLATGTGTDQFCLAAPIDDRIPKTWTGKHGKLGEILAQAMMKALRQALIWQNGLEPALTRNLVHALRRFGVDDITLIAGLQKILSPENFARAQDNYQALVHEPQTVGCAYALAEIRDRIIYKVLPESAGHELLIQQAALLASCLACKPECYPSMRRQLAEWATNSIDFPNLVFKALALGWQEKWT